MKYMQYLAHVAYIALLLVCPSCTRQTLTKKLHIHAHATQSHQTKIPTHPPITVWIHGTQWFRRSFHYRFFDEQPSLKRALDINHASYLHTLAHALHHASAHEFPLETFYVLGWSGKLDVQERKTAAVHLYNELNRIVKEYEEQHQITPFIRIITHSHGGNIALHLAQIARENDSLKQIDELILLACPVQHNTKHCVQDPLFKKTYAFYSSMDFAQVIAPQFTYSIHTHNGNVRSEILWPPLSARRFMAHPSVIQARIKLNGRALFHNEFSAPHFVQLLPEILHATESLTHEPEHNHLLCIYTNRNNPTQKIYA